MSIETRKIQLAQGREITIETGKVAKQAAGAVTVRQGDTIVLVTVCSAAPRPGIDYFPLQVDYREGFSAAGKFPGGYFKREGRPTEKEILTARMTDRPLRPLFPKGFCDEVQIVARLLSADGENEADVLAMLGASAALMLSDIPFAGPVGAVRVGRVDGNFIVNPTHPEMDESDIDLVYAGVPGKTIMIEGSAKEISEEVLRDALLFADEQICKLVQAQNDLAAAAGKPKKTPDIHFPGKEMIEAMREFCRGKLEESCMIFDKQQRQAALGTLLEQAREALEERFAAQSEAAGDDVGVMLAKAFDEVTEETVRRLVLEQGKRSDGRGVDDLRPISVEVGVLPRTHGSALFSRGETQALVSTTLGAEGDAQEFDVITGGEPRKKFILHYNFPPFSVGEVRRIGGPGRREIGHGALAERSLAGLLPEDFPYAVRCVSDILGSNGSSSMASVCGGSLALMDAGVPLAKSVAGISIGLVSDFETGKKVFLTDILGSEDHYGDMDFKIAGTRDGITGFQLDLKIAGLEIEAMYQAMQKNHAARMRILDIMEACIDKPRPQMSPYAPKVRSLHINPEKIGALIGPGGKVIRGIVERTGAQIDVLPDGTVNVFAVNGDAMDQAVRQIESVTAEAEIGKIYKGQVKSVRDFGAFVEILPGQDGLLHISEMADHRVEKVEDICKVGDWVTVKVIDIDDRGRIRLSRKAALREI